MRALAEYARDLGWQVSGSDAAVNGRVRGRLEQCGVTVHEGHSSEHISPGLDALLYSPAVPGSNVERRAARERNLAEASYPQFLGAVSRERQAIAVAGTHGKSTTTALIAEALSDAGKVSAVFCGAEILSRERHGWAGPGNWAVIEACEYRRHFLDLSPEIGVILGIEPDHFDCFSDLDDAIGAYSQFLARIRPTGLALINVDQDSSQGLARGGGRIETLSAIGAAADWSAVVTRHSAAGVEMNISFHGELEARISLPILGSHHSANALAAFAALRAAGLSSSAIADSFARFSGLGRRLERHSDWRGVIRLDDYAHHPTAVRAVLEAIRNDVAVSSETRIVCLFQPHQVSRTRPLLDDFAAAVSVADEAWILPVYAAREDGAGVANELSREMSRRVPRPCRSAFIPSLDHALTTLETALRPGDIVVTLGAGDIDCLHYDLPRRFP
ncbi:UDP-N-acetylmuramate--L-alanine ligase MurC [Caulifigura coniformis]|uniref:UDP-N-acetylmuramate--L-alanine ligase MurC n=2 Tax=Caulifigura coniformis TaxID=2527983 RepID=A0A517SHR3_9PLAN|nr:UDP-N-acetylmuramate--L-alanine ligase MurC [Caulifigura coniformis]